MSEGTNEREPPSQALEGRDENDDLDEDEYEEQKAEFHLNLGTDLDSIGEAEE